jgi:hypothetical protein
VRIGVITFPGSLDDRDAARAVRLAGAEPVALWHGDRDLRGVDAVEAAFEQLREAYGVPGATIGSVGGDSLAVDGCFVTPLAELAAVYARTLPALFGPVLSD